MKMVISTGTNKINFRRSLRLELRRSILSSRFMLGVGLMLGWMILNAAESVKTYKHAQFAGIVQLIRLGMTNYNATGPVFLAISTIPYTFSYLTEKECGYQNQAMERIGSMTYGAGKVTAVALSAFLMGVIALGSFIGICSLVGIPHTVRLEEVQYSYAVWAAAKGPGWYYAAKFFHAGLVCGQAAVFSLMILGWMPNAYVGFLSPLIAYYLIECVESIVSRMVDISVLLRLFSPNVIFYEVNSQNILFHYLWSIFMLLWMAVFFGISFLVRLSKEHME